MLLPISYICNQKCIFCSANIEKCKEQVFFDDLIKEVRSNFKKDDLVGISGGEPFLSPTLMVYLIKEAKSRNLKIEILSNGTLITKNKKLIDLIYRDIDIFNISIPAHEKKTDYEITKLKKAFEDREEGVQYLLEKKLPVRVTHIINKINYKNLEDFSLYVSKKFPKVKFVQFSFVKGIGAAKDNKKIIPKYSDVAPYLTKAFEVFKKNKIKFIYDHIPICFLSGFEKNSVDYNKITNDTKGDYLFEKEKVAECKYCPHNIKCPGPRKDYIKLYKKLR